MTLAARLRRATVTLLLTFAASASATDDPPLLWPLEVDLGLTASFGELRGNRLHTGIDLRTGEVGLPVRAVAAGRVIRMKERWRGYGLAVYIEHPGGLVSVYAHLDRVAPGLEQRLDRRRQKRRARYAGNVDLTPPIAVARGEVFAWSGESGAGRPHLHFEVRRGMGTPVDPFDVGLSPPRDTTPPVAEHLLIEPAGPGALVAGGNEPVAFDLVAVDGVYRPAEPIAVAGPVLFALRAHDLAGNSARAGVGGLRVGLDGDELYNLDFSRIPFGSNHTAGVVLDLGRSHLSPSWYTYRLTGLEGAALPFARGRRGPIELAPGEHHLTIDIEDAVSPLGARTRVEVVLEASAAVVRDDDPFPLTSADLAAERAGTLARAVVEPDRTTTLSAGQSRLTVGAGKAWAPITIVARTVAAAVPDGLTLLADAIELRPDGHPFRAPVDIAFPGLGTKRSGVYRLDRTDGSWSPVDFGSTAEIRRLGTYALIDDHAPPTIGETEPAAGARIEAGAVTVVLPVRDLGAGIPERGVTARVGDDQLDVWLDPDHDRATATWQATPGTHTIEVSARDWVGNTTRRTIAVEVAAPQPGE